MKNPKPKPNYSRARHFDIQKHWRKLGPIFKSEEAGKIWQPCMEDWGTLERGKKYTDSRPHPTPFSYDSPDWWCERHKRGPLPAFYAFTCHRACHWLVDLCLYVAMTAYPDVRWRILTHWQLHSTVWNGDLKTPVLFDANYSAHGVSAKEGLERAYKGRQLPPGRYLKKYLHIK